MKSLAAKMKSGIPERQDKFKAADTAMAAGNLLTTSAVKAEQQPTSVSHREQPKTVEGTRTVVRENFSFPPSDSELIDLLRKRAAKGGVLLNRSELLRAGLAALNQLSDTEIALVADQVPKIKTGRPKIS